MSLLRVTMTEVFSHTNSFQKLYDIEFDDEALEEWDALDGSVRKKFEKKLRKLIQNPHSPGNALTGGLAGCYKIKLRDDGYRLVYTVEAMRIVIFVIAVGKREESVVYNIAQSRIK